MEVKRSKSNFRAGSSRNAGSRDTFAQQMADYAIGERFRELREQHPDRPSRERVAAEIGVSTKTLYAWEHDSGIHWENAKAAAAFYGVRPESLVSREEVRPGDYEPVDPYAEKLDKIIEEQESQREILEEIREAVTPTEDESSDPLVELDDALAAPESSPPEEDLGDIGSGEAVRP